MIVRNLTLPKLHCHRCIYTWTPARTPVRMCPRCKSKLWNVPKIRPLVLGSALGIEEILLPHRTEILRLARRYRVKRVWVFGSVRRRQATANSDVDLMVEWTRPDRHSILDRAGLCQEIEKVLGREVDLVNRGGLHWAVQPQVEAEAVPL